MRVNYNLIQSVITIGAAILGFAGDAVKDKRNTADMEKLVAKEVAKQITEAIKSGKIKYNN